MASFAPEHDLDLSSSSLKHHPSRRLSTSTASSFIEKDSEHFHSGANPQAAHGARKTRPPHILIVPITEQDLIIPSASTLLCVSATAAAAASASASLLEQTTKPIEIPTANPLHRRDPISRPTTPLTAREEKAGHEFPWHDTSPLRRPTISQSLRPTYSFQRQSERKPREVSPQKQQLVSRSSLHMQEDVATRKYNVSSSASARMHKENPTSLYTPSSPLSPTMTSSTLPYGIARRTAQPLQLPALPRYHPSNYERATPIPSLSSSTGRPSTTYRSSARSPQPHQRQLSDAQYKLHQYQRDIITTATRQSRPAAPSINGTTRPVSPRLNPLGSPGPVTPMMLEEQTDYLLAGAASRGLSSGSFGEAGHRDLVERLVRAGKESGALARSGSSSPVSPAGGRG